MVARDGVAEAQRGLDMFAKSHRKAGPKAGASLNLPAAEVDKTAVDEVAASGVWPQPGSFSSLSLVLT